MSCTCCCDTARSRSRGCSSEPDYEKLAEAGVDRKALALVAVMRDVMPSKSAMLRWLAKYEDFRDHYARASAVRSGVFMEETIDITDNASNDWMEINDGENRGWRANGENIQRSKLRVETRKWMAIKLLPKMYGDKTIIVNEVPDTSNLTLEEIDILLPLMAKISSAKAGVN